MNIIQEHISTLLAEETIKKVKAQFQSGTEVLNLDSYGSNYRLKKYSAGNIVLQTTVMVDFGSNNKTDNEDALFGEISKTIMVQKPVGFYSISKSNSAEIEITILKEYEKEFEIIELNSKVKFPCKVTRMSLLENAIIASFSLEAGTKACQFEDASMFVNGFKIDFYRTTEQLPGINIFLDNSYGFKECVASYRVLPNGSVDTGCYDIPLFHHLIKMGLLSGFNG
jgi:hypothetical protein